MNDIAIQYEKIIINDDWFLFKPIGVVKGRLDNEEEVFESEFGTYLYLINGMDPDMEYYYSSPTTLKELKKSFGELSEDALLSEYFLMSVENCILGFYEDEKIKTIAIPFDNIEKLLDRNVNFSSEALGQESAKFIFDENALKELRDLNSLNEIRNRLDSIINISKNIASYVKENEKIEGKKTLKVKKEESKKFNYKNLKKVVLSNIIAQDKAVEDVTTGIAINYKSSNPRHKSHILIAGPSGTGKTEMMNVITKELGVPCFKADATAYTKEGYVGKSVYSMLSGLIEAANGDIEKAQKGILIIDEIDKKATSSKDDVGGQAVLNSLLKIMDRGLIEINKDYYFSETFDTSNLTIVFMGAFTDLYEKKKNNRSIGFGQDSSSVIKIDELTEQDFIDYGMPSEFMGRIGIITHTNKFSMENLIQILKNSKISPLKIEQEFFNELGVKLTYTSSYIKEIALKSQNSKLGARDLKKVVKETLKYVYQEVLLNNKIKEVKLTKDTVNNPKKYYIK